MQRKAMILLFFCTVFFPAIGQAGTNDELIQRIASASNQELAKLTFFELNILKNAIYSSRGFKYADDRPWLYEYFYNAKSKIEKPGTASPWDLGQYHFPKPDAGTAFQVDSQMEKSITNIRAALYKKIRSFGDMTEIDKIIDQAYVKHGGKNDTLFIMGRKVVGQTGRFKDSIRREVHGYYCIIHIIKDPSQFDAAELLGVYVGSVVLLKNIIQAQQGKIFEGSMGWEISQLAGVTPKDARYDENKLPQEIKDKLKLLDEIIKKMTQSDMGDIPEQFKNKTIRVDLEYIEGC